MLIELSTTFGILVRMFGLSIASNGQLAVSELDELRIFVALARRVSNNQELCGQQGMKDEGCSPKGAAVGAQMLDEFIILPVFPYPYTRPFYFTLSP